MLSPVRPRIHFFSLLFPTYAFPFSTTSILHRFFTLSTSRRLSCTPRSYSNSPSNSNFIATVAVIGTGQMGTGIAICSALHANHRTILYDSEMKNTANALDYIQKYLERQCNLKKKITDNQFNAALANVSMTASIQDLAQADFMIEAVTENIDVKHSIIDKLTQVSADHNNDVVIATNTSSISISAIAGTRRNAHRIIGMHFFNPVPVMKVIEIIPGLQTSKDTLDKTCALAKAMNKQTCIVQDSPGFISNRLLMPYINEAIQVLSEGLAFRDDIDNIMHLGTNVPMGPLKLADFIGLDTCLSIMKVLHEELGEDKYRPSPLLVKYVRAGRLGKKSGKGFYDY